MLSDIIMESEGMAPVPDHEGENDDEVEAAGALLHMDVLEEEESFFSTDRAQSTDRAPSTDRVDAADTDHESSEPESDVESDDDKMDDVEPHSNMSQLVAAVAAAAPPTDATTAAPPTDATAAPPTDATTGTPMHSAPRLPRCVPHPSHISPSHLTLTPHPHTTPFTHSQIYERSEGKVSSDRYQTISKETKEGHH